MTDAPIPNFDALMEIAERLHVVGQQDPRLAAAEPGDLIRNVAGKRAIFEGVFEGRDVVFRLNYRPEEGAPAREWAEIERLWPYMAEGDLRIAEPVYANTGAGVIVLERVPGTPMLTLMRRLEAAERVAFFAPAARWLRQSTAMTDAPRVAGTAGWVRRARAASEKQPFPALRALEVQILEQMERLGPHIEGALWRTAISHGDFHPNNLIVDGARITGIDLGGSTRMPIYKDMARFVMHIGRRRIEASGQRALGVDLAALKTFAEVFALTQEERAVVLPFFLAFEALIRVEIRALPKWRIKAAEAMYRDLLSDLARTGPGTPLF
ncbi:aminoglycoside phosphotransferase family protein [Roseovarius sp. LXJ103]|uniref:phosphotransferase n=1 Tax=Roseovarius carneus TaxID=2853164 RepID=UPI000D611B1C|nr:phosphotransferase [Roseovarius carneus]MBZ8119347.1 aminoglycoside phosphotransferase family protein [Roseovarius carneus]PWE35043.1 hypothetical protein DD563_03080 [Pelagicola sp. LXJ1103]